MDYKKYSEELETIIAAINLPEHTRILVNALIKEAMAKCEKDNNDKGFIAMQSGKPA